MIAAPYGAGAGLGVGLDALGNRAPTPQPSLTPDQISPNADPVKALLLLGFGGFLLWSLASNSDDE
jgi:hypothetical protein